MRTLLNIVTWTYLTLAAASAVLWLWPGLSFEWGHSGRDYYLFVRGSIATDVDCGKCGLRAHIHVLLPMALMTFVFLALPLVRMINWLKNRPDRRGFPVELSQGS